MDRAFLADVLAPQLDRESPPNVRIALRDGRRYSVVRVVAALADWAILDVHDERNSRLELTLRYEEITTLEVEGGTGVPPWFLTERPLSPPLAATWAEFKAVSEEAFLRKKLEENDWNVAETARIIDMPRSNLYKKIERFGLRREGGGTT